MAKCVNKAILLGGVGKDPEVRALPSGTKVATISLATSDRFKDKTGEWKEQTEWHTAVAYGRVAEIIEKYVQKGSRLYIEGKIETRSWEDARSGEKKYQTQIKIDDLVLAGGGKTQSAPQPPATPAASSPSHDDNWEDFN